jgi:hypothetical protein
MDYTVPRIGSDIGIFYPKSWKNQGLPIGQLEGTLATAVDGTRSWFIIKSEEAEQEIAPGEEEQEGKERSTRPK